MFRHSDAAMTDSFCLFSGESVTDSPAENSRATARAKTKNFIMFSTAVQSCTKTSCGVRQPPGQKRSFRQREKKSSDAFLQTSLTRPTQSDPPTTEMPSTTLTLYIMILPASSWQHPIKWCVSKVYLLVASLTLGTPCSRVTGFFTDYETSVHPLHTASNL